MLNESYVVIGLLVILIFITFLIFIRMSLVKSENKELNEQFNKNFDKSLAKTEMDITTGFGKQSEITSSSAKEIISELKSHFEGATLSQIGRFNLVEEKFDKTLTLLQAAARTSTKTGIGAKGIFISKETIGAYVSENSYPEFFKDLKNLFYWQDYFIQVSTSFENELYFTVHKIFDKGSYFVTKYRGILVAPYSEAAIEQSVKFIEQHISFLKDKDRMNASAGLSIQNADILDQFVDNPNFSKKINGFLSKQLLGILVNVKSLEAARKDILAIWNEINNATQFVNREMEPLMSKGVSADDSDFKAKVQEFKTRQKRVESLLISFANQRLIRFYNQLREAKQLFGDKIQSEFKVESTELNAWMMVYDEVLTVLTDYLKSKLDISIISTKIGAPFNPSIHHVGQEAIKSNDFATDKVVTVVNEGFEFNGKDNVSRMIKKVDVIISL